MPTALITGANRGLGLEFARQYAREGWRVMACARSPDAPALRALAEESGSRVSVHALDVTDGAAVAALAVALSGQPVDVLLNVAGVIGGGREPAAGGGRQRFGAQDYEDWKHVLDVNVLGPMRMAEAFIGHLEAGEQKKIVSLTSRMGSIADNTSGGYYVYRSSKAALNAVVKSLAIDLAPRGIIAVPIHPGWVRTDMGGPSAPLSVEDSAAGIREVIAGLAPADSGRFLRHDGSELPW